MFYITGDTHRDFSRFYNKGFTEEDAIIILGDAGINYCLNINDAFFKRSIVTHTPATIYCVRGNHEERPENIPTMEIIYDEKVNGDVYYESDYPSIRYFMDGGIYEIEGLRTLVIGGAYSIDKDYRLRRNNYEIENSGWFPQEQLSIAEQKEILKNVKGQSFDLILTHTCPISVEPHDLFLSGIDQATVDKSMEAFLEDINKNVDWFVWAFGHFHRDRVERPHVEQFFTDIEPLKELYVRWNNPQQAQAAYWVLDKSPNYDDTTYSENSYKVKL